MIDLQERKEEACSAPIPEEWWNQDEGVSTFCQSIVAITFGEAAKAEQREIPLNRCES